MLRKLSLAIVALAALAHGAPVQMEPSITKFGAESWIQGARVTRADEIEVTFVAKTCPEKRAALEEKFWDVSNPKSKSYKNYLSLDEVADFLHPEDTPLHSTAIVEALNTAHAESHGRLLVNTPRVTKTRDLVTVTMRAQEAEKFFSTELFHFKHGAGSAKLIRAGAPYYLDESLSEHVLFVEKLVRLPRVRSTRISEGVSPRLGGDDEFNSCDSLLCSEATTPDVLRTRYNIPVLESAQSSNSMACAEFQFQGLDDEDLSNFASTCGVDHVEVDNTIGKGGDSIPGVEALLDIEYIEAVAAPINLTVINSIQFSLYDWMESVNNDPNTAWVHSVSYGNDEVQQESTEYMYDCNTQFMKAGVRGLSVLFASGDQGVWGRTGHTGSVFHPDFPAGSPYITAVGGTDFVEKSTMGDEKTWNDGGGGFSNTFGIPDYQADAVATYFSSGVDLPDASYYNASGRGYPDVAALAGNQNGYCVAAKGKFMKVGGTSAACPVFAGVVALINDELIANGKAPMGYLNQWIYGVAGPAGAFNDVTTGNNNAGFGPGFEATTGWDPATGYGTPDYERLLALAQQ